MQRPSCSSVLFQQSAQQQIVIASSNKGKLKEFSQLFDATGIRLLPQSHFNISGADETGLSFIENAIIKARHASSASALPAIADDSGIVVDALDGAPGIYSARYAGASATDADNIAKLLDLMKSVPADQRGASFYCSLVYLRYAEDPMPVICHGQWRGLITEAVSGREGFGYDPVFYIPEKKCTAAELSLPVKNQISHRAQAISAFKRMLFS